MNNLEKIKKQVRKMTVDDMANLLIERGFGRYCDHCIYEDNYVCNEDCDYGIRAWLNKDVKK